MIKEIKAIEEIKSINGVSSEEKETCITIAYTDTFAALTTNDNSWITKMKKCFEANPEEFICTQNYSEASGEIYSYTFTFPKKYLTIRSKKRAKRILSEEQRQAAANRLRASRKKKATD